MSGQNKFFVLNPVLDGDLSDDLQGLFFGLLRAVNEVHDETSCENCCNIIEAAVTQHPVLAKTVKSENNLQSWTLLLTICAKNFSGFRRAIKFLIEQNPHALAWNGTRAPNTSPICVIASTHSELMPWIAEHHSWVFEHPNCLETSPIQFFLFGYARGACDALVVRQFFESYPQGLETAMHWDLPIHHCIRHVEDCDADLIKWMARQCPDSMSNAENYFGFTPLHCACIELSKNNATGNTADKLADICCFLASECPASIRAVSSEGGLPIHYIANWSDRPAVQKVLLALLRAHPVPIDMAAVPSLPFRRPRSVRFLQSVTSLIQEETELKEHIVQMEDTKTAWSEAMLVAKGALLTSVATVFQTWTTLSIDQAQQRIAAIAEHINDACREHEDEGAD